MKEVRVKPRTPRRTPKPRGCLVVFAILAIITLIGSCFGGSKKEPENESNIGSLTELSTEGTTSVVNDAEPIENSLSSNLTVHFLDVGQGLSILCESNGHYLLYDGGDSDKSSFVVSYLKKEGVESLDYIIASNYDSDHLNGVIGALNVFDIGTIIGPDYVHDSKLYESFITKTKELGKAIVHPAVKDEFTFGECTFEVIGPSNLVENANNNSIAIKLKCGDTSFIFVGDAEQEEENDLMQSGVDLKCNVLQIGHHGSATSTTKKYLQTTAPEYAVISCGENNQYGHPSADTMEQLKASGIQIFRTDKQGTIIAKSNGSSISWSTDPSTDFSSGTMLSESVAESSLEATLPAAETVQPNNSADYILNNNSMKFHYPSCKSVKKIKPENYEEFQGDKNELIQKGYTPCGNCKP